MPIIRHVAVVFRVAAGPRLGFGHLVRCRAIARALGVEARVSIRGTAATRRAGTTLGLQVMAGGPGLLDREAPRVLVVDDPSAAAARPWVGAARRRGVAVVVIGDGAKARLDADLTVDGSVVAAPDPADRTRLCGPRYAVVDPSVAARRAARWPTDNRILVAVGGGAHVFAHVPAVVAALARQAPGADILVAPGFTARRGRPSTARGALDFARAAGRRPGRRARGDRCRRHHRLRGVRARRAGRGSLGRRRAAADRASPDAAGRGRRRRRSRSRRGRTSGGRPGCSPARRSRTAATSRSGRPPARRWARRRTRGGRHPSAGAPGRGP